MYSKSEGPNNMKHHIVSGAAVSLLAAGTVNAMKFKKGEVDAIEATKEVVKRTTQGTIATASIVAATSYKNQKNGMLKSLLALGVGAAGVYAVEMLDKKFSSKNDIEELELQAQEEVQDEQ